MQQHMFQRFIGVDQVISYFAEKSAWSFFLLYGYRLFPRAYSNSLPGRKFVFSCLNYIFLYSYLHRIFQYKNPILSICSINFNLSVIGRLYKSFYLWVDMYVVQMLQPTPYLKGKCVFYHNLSLVIKFLFLTTWRNFHLPFMPIFLSLNYYELGNTLL